MKLFQIKALFLLIVLLTPMVLSTVNQFQESIVICDFNTEEERSENESNEMELEDFILENTTSLYFSISKSILFNNQTLLFTSIFQDILLPPPQFV